MTDTTSQQQFLPVCRKTRRRFIFGVVFTTIFLSALFTLLGGLGAFSMLYSQLVMNFVDAAMGLATASVLAYITGSVVDYNGGVRNLFTRREPTAAVPVPSAYAAPVEGAKG
ncbi:hypothetical protein RPALISO_74 [Ruegeria phage RpAliso]|nr:hypothetical protein RPALISO_74 [Ruegeria phage RpAliso]